VNRKARLALLAAFAVGQAGTVQAQEKTPLSIGSVFASRQGWTIGPSSSGKNCLAAGTFTGGTTIWIGFGESGESLVAFTNPDWKSIDPENEYAIVIRSGRRTWHGKFKGFERRGEKGIINVGLKSEFLIDLARAGGIAIAVEGANVARLSMAGSAAALVSAIECQKEHGSAPQEARAKPPGESRRESGGSSGTGFFVSAKGHVLTNHHVVQSCTRFMVAAPGDQPRAAKVIANDSQNDLAILATDMTPTVVPAFNTRPRVGEGIHVYGFPLSGMLATSGNFTLGNVTATQAMMARLSQLQDMDVMADEHASLAKAYCTVKCRETVGWARELLGGNGILLENHIGRFVADAEAIYSYEGTREMNTLIVGKSITGLSAFV